MAQKMLEERMKSNEREVIGLKEIIFEWEVIGLKEIISELKESWDRLAEEIKKSVTSWRKEELGTFDVLVRKTEKKKKRKR